MARTVIVGDVHGCLTELLDLFARVALSPSDRVHFVGDLIARGPDTVGVLNRVLKVQGLSVRGNHEDKLLSYLIERANGKKESKLGRNHQQLVRQLRFEHWRMLMDMPLWIDLPEHGLRIVHAGVPSRAPIERVPIQFLLSMRGFTESGEPTALRSSEPWGLRYEGPPHVVFGHNALMSPQVHPWATGIDTGCVYGGFLTAMVLSENQQIPPASDRLDVLVSVPSRKSYCPMRVGALASGG